MAGPGMASSSTEQRRQLGSESNSWPSRELFIRQQLKLSCVELGTDCLEREAAMADFINLLAVDLPRYPSFLNRALAG